MKKNSVVSRRAFFERAALLGAGAAGALYIAGCDRPAPGDDTAERAAPAAGDSACDISGLTDAEAQMRRSLDYVDQTPNPDETCLNCGLWVEAEGDATCGGCELPLGPVHPDGWCNSWVPAG